MYFNPGKGSTIRFTLLLLLFSYQPITAKANAQQSRGDIKSVLFTAQPEQCVTLRQGRDCFASIQLQWQTPTEQTVCLFREKELTKIKCWQKSDHGEVAIEFESNESITYQLRTVNDDKLIAQTQIKVSWLHKSSARKRRWRLF